MKERLRSELAPAAEGGWRSRLASSRVMRFGLVGASGIPVNLAVLQLLAGGLRWPEAAASAAAIEASILWNFVLNDRFTFRRERAAAGPLLRRLLAFHAVAAVGAIVQLAVFVAGSAVLLHALGRTELGPLRHLAQGAGIALAFSWNYLASAGFAWRTRAAAAPTTALERAAPVLFFALLVLHVLPMWLVAWFPTQDGPLHVENVLALVNHHGSPLLQRFYLANWGAQPNWLTQALLAGLLQAFSPPIAEKVLLTGYVVLFPLLFRAALPRGTRGWWAALAVFPFLQSYPFHMGFWNFCYGLALMFGAVAVWWRHRGRLSRGRALAVAALAILLFLAHSVAFASFGIVAAALLAWRAGLSLHRARGHPARRRRVVRAYARRAAGTVAVLVPGSILLAGWLLAHRDRISARIPFPELAARLGVLYALVSIDRRELFLAAAVALALAVAVVHALLARTGRGLRPQDGWLAAAAAFAVLYFAVPDVVASGAHISDRLAILSALCGVAWLGAGTAPLPAVRRFAVGLSAVALLALGVRMDKQRALASYLDEYESARAAIRPGSVVLPLALSPHGPRDEAGRRLGYRVKPFLHAGGWIVAEQGGVDLKNSQANTDHCPVRWPRDRNPFHTIAPSLGAMEGTPPCVDVTVGAPDGGPIDYVLVWGATPEMLARPCGLALAHELQAGFERVFVSAPHGLLEVWRPRASATVQAAGR